MFWDKLPSFRTLDLFSAQEARKRAYDLLMPLFAMGRCHDLVERLSAIQGRSFPHLDRPGLILFAGDHGVVSEGVTAYPSTVTRIMVEVFLQGGGTCNALIREVGGKMAIVNAGVLEPIKGFPASREVVLFVDQPIRHGTRNFLIEPALTFEELDKAIELGFEVGRSFIRENDLDLLVVGEMGIGNTTSASVLTAWLLGLPAESVVGHGADLPPERLKVKQSVVKKALQVWGDRVRDGKDALAYWGGLEIGAMVGAFFACGVEGVAGVVDGFIATVAAAWAVQFAPDLKGFLIASHESAEPGHRALLQRFGWEPLLQWGMRLGEGTGALMVVPLLRLAVSFHKEVWTFSSLGLRRGG